MDELSAQGFCAFVAEQPENREIHHGMGWGCCAVGEYVTDALGVYKGLEDWDDRASDFAMGVLQHELPGELYKAMNIGAAHSHLATYGGLNRYIEETRA